MTRLRDMFTVQRDCFLPCGDTTKLDKQLEKPIDIFWDSDWNRHHSSTRALIHFCEDNPSGYRQRIPKPDVFMFSPIESPINSSPHPIYPEDFVFSDAADSIGMRLGRVYHRGYTNIECTGMLPLVLKEHPQSEHPNDWPHAHLLDVHITDGRDHGHTTMLIWALSTSEVLAQIAKHKLPIQYYWSRPGYRKIKRDVLMYCRDNDVPLQYYIGRKPRRFNKRIASFRGVEIYDVSKSNVVKSWQ